MSDIIDSLTGNSMLHLKQDIAYLRQCLAECTDAVILVVSEETGAISLAYDSRLHYDLTLDQATKTLENILDISGDDDKDSANER